MEKQRIDSHRDLVVWQKSIDLVELVYQLTNGFPREELYGLTSQMRRAAVSISSNIAEGKSRGTRKDYRLFIIHAYGSASELETQMIIAKKLKLAGVEKFRGSENLLIEVSKMLRALITSLKT